MLAVNCDQPDASVKAAQHLLEADTMQLEHYECEVDLLFSLCVCETLMDRERERREREREILGGIYKLISLYSHRAFINKIRKMGNIFTCC